MYDNMSTMVYIKEDKLEKLTQDEIISKTKQVIQGLEALRMSTIPFYKVYLRH